MAIAISALLFLIGVSALVITFETSKLRIISHDYGQEEEREHVLLGTLAASWAAACFMAAVAELTTLDFFVVPIAVLLGASAAIAAVLSAHLLDLDLKKFEYGLRPWRKIGSLWGMTVLGVTACVVQLKFLVDGTLNMPLGIAVLLFSFAALALGFLVFSISEEDWIAILVAVVLTAVFAAAGVLELTVLSTFVIPIGVILCVFALVFGYGGMMMTFSEEEYAIGTASNLAMVLFALAGIYQLAALT